MAADAVVLEQQALVEVAKAEIGMDVEICFRPQQERLGADRFEDDVRDLHRRLARRRRRLEGEQDAPLRIGFAENLAQVAGNQHRFNLGQVELLGRPAGGKRLVETNDDRRHLAAAAMDLDPAKRLDRVQFHDFLAVPAGLLGRAPRLFHLLHAADSGRYPVKTASLQRRRPSRRRWLRLGNGR